MESQQLDKQQKTLKELESQRAWQIGKPLDSEGKNRVYMAMIPCAVKLDVKKQEVDMARQIMRTSRIPNIVKYYTVEQDALSMEYLHWTLEELVAKKINVIREALVTQLNARNYKNLLFYAHLQTHVMAASLLLMIDGLQQMHEIMKIVHRDIKPSNIGISTDYKLKYFDFEMAAPLAAGKCYAEVDSITPGTSWFQSLRIQELPVDKGKDIKRTYLVKDDLDSLLCSALTLFGGMAILPWTTTEEELSRQEYASMKKTFWSRAPAPVNLFNVGEVMLRKLRARFLGGHPDGVMIDTKSMTAFIENHMISWFDTHVKPKLKTKVAGASFYALKYGGLLQMEKDWKNMRAT